MDTLDLVEFEQLVDKLNAAYQQVFKYAAEYAELTEFSNFKYLTEIDFEGASEENGFVSMEGEEYCYGDISCFSLSIPTKFIFGDDNYRQEFKRNYLEEKTRAKEERIAKDKKVAKQQKEEIERQQYLLYLQLKEKFDEL